MKYQKFLLQIFDLMLVVLLLAACSASTPTGTSIPPIATPIPTPIPPTPTPRPTLAIIPTTIIPTPELFLNASGTCFRSFSKKMSTKSALAGNMGNVLVLMKARSANWEVINHQVHGMPARSLSDLTAIVCVKEGREKTGQYYEDRKPAYRLHYDVRIISWPDGEVIAAKKFIGGKPPTVKYEEGPGYGHPPHNDFMTWLESLLPPPEQQVMILPTGGIAVNHFEFSPDGKLLTADGKVWEVETGKEVVIAAQTKEDFKIDFLPDGKLLAWSHGNGTVKVWEAETGKEVITFTPRIGKFKHYLPDMTFLSGGKLLAWKMYEKVEVWEVETGKKIATLADHKDRISIDFSPDGKVLASGGQDGKVILWEVETGKKMKTLVEGAGPFYGVAFSPDGSLLAGKELAGKESKRVILWETETGREITTFNYEVNPWITFSPDGRLWAAGNLDKATILWMTEIGGETEIAGIPGEYKVEAFSPDGKLLVLDTDGGTVILWEVPKP